MPTDFAPMSNADAPLSPRSPLRLCCSGCGWSTACGQAEMQSWLLRAGMLRRNEHPAEAEMRELLPVAACKLTCPGCGARGLAIAEAGDDDNADWPTARRCQSCGQEIPPERLEVFPDVELCVECQRRVDAHLPQPTGEFCDRCGWPMILRASTGRGITRQVMACSNPQCRGAKSAAR